MALDPANRRTVGVFIAVSGTTMIAAGLYLLFGLELQLAGGVLFGAGILDLVLAVYFLRG